MLTVLAQFEKIKDDKGSRNCRNVGLNVGLN